MDILILGGVVVIGSIVFWVLVQNSIIINPSASGFFSWWLGCVVGTAVVLMLLINMVGGVVLWIIDFIKEYYMYIIGAFGILAVIGYFAGGESNAEHESSVENKVE